MPMDAIANLSVKNPALESEKPVRLLNAGLDERGDDIIAQGWIDLESMHALRVDEYQREVLGALTSGRKSSLRKAVEEGARLPNIIIGMRGERYEVKGGTMTLLDRCYIVDGLQRIAAMLHYAETHPEDTKNVRIGAEIRFNTNKDSERELFLALNTSRVPVAPAVILRNLRQDHPSILTLYGLSHNDTKFALHDRVSWNQRMARHEFITAQMLAKTASALHGPASVQGGRSERPHLLAAALDGYAKHYGLTTFRRNVATFFEIIDQCFGIRSIQYKEVSPQLRGNFLNTVARVFAQHEDFWGGEDNKSLEVSAEMRRKLSAFPINDPEVMRLCGAGNSAMPILMSMMVDHFNYKRHKSNYLKRKA